MIKKILPFIIITVMVVTYCKISIPQDTIVLSGLTLINVEALADSEDSEVHGCRFVAEDVMCIGEDGVALMHAEWY